MPLEGRLITGFAALLLAVVILLSFREGRIVISPVNISRRKHTEGFWAVIGLQGVTAASAVVLAIWP